MLVGAMVVSTDECALVGLAVQSRSTLTDENAVSNPFKDFADQVVPYARKRKLEKQKFVPKTAQEKKQAEQDKLHELWLEDFAKKKQALLDSKYGAQALALCAKLEALSLDDGDLLIEMAKVWQYVDHNTRFLVLNLIDSAMVELRERHMWPPIDDPLPDEPDSAFISIRKILS